MVLAGTSYLIRPGVTVLAVLLGLAVIHAGVPASAVAADSPGTITVVGEGDSSALVQVTRRITLDTGILDPMGGPRYGRGDVKLPSSYFGFAFSRIRDGKVVAGRIRSRYLEREMGVKANLPVGADSILEPGRYRLTLFGKGPTRLVLHTKDLARSVTWKTGKPANVRFELAPLAPSSSRPYLLEHRAKIEITPRKYVGYGIVSKRVTPNPEVSYACLAPPGADLCASSAIEGDPNSTGPFVTLTAGSSGTQNWTQPGAMPPGAHELLYQGTPAIPGNTTAYVLLAFS